MIDALLFAVQDGIRAAGMNYGVQECGIEDSGQPPPVCGNVYVAIHNGRTRPGEANDNNLFELYDFTVTLTMRVTIPLDRVGDQLIARNIALVPLGQRQGFNHKVEQLRTFLHMNWRMTVLYGNGAPASANDNLIAWGTGTVYGFCEPARYQGVEGPRLVGGEHFHADPDSDDVGLTADLQFVGAKRFQPQTAAAGPFL